MYKVWFIIFVIHLHGFQQNVMEDEIRKSQESTRKGLLTIPQLDKPKQIGKLVDAVTITLLMAIPRRVEYDDMEVSSDAMYVCAKNGYLQNMESISHDLKGVKSTENSDGGFRIVIPFSTISGLDVKYHNYVQHFIMNVLGDRKGDMRPGFVNIDVNIIVTADPPSEVVDKLNSNKCIVTINSVTVTLTKPYSTVNIEGTERVLKLPIFNTYNTKLKVLLEGYLNTHVKQIEEKVGLVYLESLVKYSNWICLEDSDRERIKKGHNKPLFRPTSENFIKFCGNK